MTIPQEVILDVAGVSGSKTISRTIISTATTTTGFRDPVTDV